MPGFVDCWNQLSKNKERGGEPVLTNADRSFIESRIQEQVRAGYSPLEAAKMAVQKHLDQAHEQLGSIYEQAGVTKGGDKPVTAAVPESPPAAEPVTDEPHVSAIANRFVEERVKQGQIGEIAPGEGFSTAELAQRGLRMPPEEVSQHISDLVQGTGDPIKQGMAVRAEEARLSKRSTDLSKAAEANPTVEAKLAADNAFKDLTDFHNGPVAKLKQNFHAQGMSLQGELPIDLSTFNGLREAWLKDTGEVPPPSVEPKLRQMAKEVSGRVAEENGAASRLGAEVEKVTSRRKLPTPEEVRNNILERMKDAPCRV